MIGSIYLVTDGTFSYVGQSTVSPAARFASHAMSIMEQSGAFANTNPDITKWTFSVLEVRECRSKDDVTLLEESWIERLNPTQNTVRVMAVNKVKEKSRKRAEVEMLLEADLTYRDIAEKTGVPLGTICNINRQKRLHKAA